jgi:hypothetical protein
LIFCSCIYWANVGKPIAVQSNEELGFYSIEIGVQMSEIDVGMYEIKSAWNFE